MLVGLFIVLVVCCVLLAVPENARKGILVAGAIACVILLSDRGYASWRGRAILFDWSEAKQVSQR